MQSPSNRVKLSARDKEVAALDLRRKGYSYRQIAMELKCHEDTVYDAVKRALKHLNETIMESAAELRRLELERYDAWLKALEPACEAGDTKAIGTAIRVSERRASLLGLDAPKQTMFELKAPKDTAQLAQEIVDMMEKK